MESMLRLLCVLAWGRSTPAGEAFHITHMRGLSRRSRGLVAPPCGYHTSHHPSCCSCLAFVSGLAFR
eukprot:scaffold1638_cov258-Pinguiococcus_pyrenoidosus.AAC.65